MNFQIPVCLYIWSRLSIAFLTLALSAGCNKDQNDDLTPPVIHLVNTVPELTSADVCETQSDLVLKIPAGGALEIIVRFTDDMELGSAKYDLHHNFDCHGHKSQKTTVWNLIEIIELSGTEQTVSKTFQSPDDVRPGLYHLGVMALDAIGQEAEMIFFDVMVFDAADSIAPVVQLNAPEEGSSHSRSNPLVIEGILEDETDLSTGGYDLIFVSPQGVELSVARVNFPAGFGAEASISHTYNIPSFVEAGPCSLKVEASDWRNNQTIMYHPFQLTD